MTQLASQAGLGSTSSDKEQNSPLPSAVLTKVRLVNREN